MNNKSNKPKNNHIAADGPVFDSKTLAQKREETK